MSLQQQIQREIDEEARIDRVIEAYKKKFLKMKCNRKYKITNNKKEANMLIIFDRTDVTKYNMVLYDEKDKGIKDAETKPR